MQDTAITKREEQAFLGSCERHHSTLRRPGSSLAESTSTHLMQGCCVWMTMHAPIDATFPTQVTFGLSPNGSVHSTRSPTANDGER